MYCIFLSGYFSVLGHHVCAAVQQFPIIVNKVYKTVNYSHNLNLKVFY